MRFQGILGRERAKTLLWEKKEGTGCRSIIRERESEGSLARI